MNNNYIVASKEDFYKDIEFEYHISKKVPSYGNANVQKVEIKKGKFNHNFFSIFDAPDNFHEKINQEKIFIKKLSKNCLENINFKVEKISNKTVKATKENIVILYNPDKQRCIITDKGNTVFDGYIVHFYELKEVLKLTRLWQ